MYSNFGAPFEGLENGKIAPSSCLFVLFAKRSPLFPYYWTLKFLLLFAPMVLLRIRVKVPVAEPERGSKWPEQWPSRAEKAPYWLLSAQVGVYGKPTPGDFLQTLNTGNVCGDGNEPRQQASPSNHDVTISVIPGRPLGNGSISELPTAQDRGWEGKEKSDNFFVVRAVLVAEEQLLEQGFELDSSLDCGREFRGSELL
ncbi:probable methyltransferase PMT26 [Tanacetum coccineum]